MARAALRWSGKDLADKAGIGSATVARFELGEAIHPDSLKAMQDAFDRAGVEFIPAGATIRIGGGTGGAGVRLRR
jgi:transcriptional regulator with XRE-family HTH domain